MLIHYLKRNYLNLFCTVALKSSCAIHFRQAYCPFRISAQHRIERSVAECQDLENLAVAGQQPHHNPLLQNHLIFSPPRRHYIRKAITMNVSRVALRAARAAAPRAAVRSYASAAAADARPPVALFGLDGTYASALVGQLDDSEMD